MDNELNNNSEEYPPQKSQPQEMPESTIWPLSLSFGLLFLFTGLVTSLYITCIGLFIIIVSLSGWIRELKQ